eukprot:CAMPEP_0201479734 /NCGR_PEP_ID=MMETSP0151_2-20130828/4378_1 /ASSEMBLY_ACC=CAM_ASM_000257 /TAXON_ID=200890 /ORGANISM="Paramoeba atlantica, Strain 621/1 / CCAP 1560/9" /LENGTH=524 /DNA_ID=CAMNT_0047861359 /DNA_START=609 /DNA_END=2183 /DNA_ORIENTATION=-
MIAAFLSAFAIGANDVANSFASAIASGLLSMRSVVMIASVTEFLGAVALGNNVSSTIRKDIVDVDLFANRQDLLMFGMFVACLSSGTWDTFATAIKMPVSTTHSIVGGVIGMGIAVYGADGVNWGFDSGVARIVFGFVMSPVISGVLAALIFTVTRLCILERQNSYRKATIATPIYAFCTTIMIMCFFVYKGSPRLNLDEKDPGIQMAIILPPSFFVAFLSVAVFLPIVRYYEKKDAKKLEEEGEKEMKEMNEVNEMGGDEVVVVDDDAENTDSEEDVTKSTCGGKTMALLNKTVLYGINQDYEGAKNEEQRELHSHVKDYDPKTENLFKWLQLFSCATASFAHGANDVANAVAPLATVYAIWNTGTSSGEVEVDTWILAYGGGGIVIGLFLLSWRIMANLGSNMTKLSPSRGFSAEMGSIIAILTATGVSLPVSTTHCITGATVAVGLCSGNVKAVNWKMLAYICLGWIFSIPCSAFCAYVIMSVCINAPNTNFVDLYMDLDPDTPGVIGENLLNITEFALYA